MSHLAEGAYGLAIRGLRLLSPLLGRGGSKLSRGVRGRREAGLRLAAWGREERDGGRPLAWLHAPSVGEGLQARAVLQALREERPGLQAAFTFFSPSAEALARRMPAQVADYLPWDLASEVGPVLDALRPDLLAFSKTEVWPILSREAERRGVSLALIAATLPRDAGRLSPPGRLFLRPAFARLARVGAISEEDGERFRRLDVDPGSIVVTGDPGIDSAWRRASTADPEAPYLRPFREDPRPTLVAGSTWEPDERVLLPALRRIRRKRPGLRLVLAPHEPEADHVAGLVRSLERDGWNAELLARVEERGSAEGVDAVVVDRVGVLAHLYTVGRVAYVGGGFHSGGLHSVLEPAAAKVPVLFGPRHHNARAARDLIREGGGRVVIDAKELERAVEAWLDDESERGEAAEGAWSYIRAHRGAAARTAAMLEPLIRP